MGIAPFWASTVSVLFRIAVGVYLRLLPLHHTLGPIIVATLVVYYLALFFQDASRAATTTKVEVIKGEVVDVKITEDSNGVPIRVESISAKAVVTAVDSQPSVCITITYSYASVNVRLALRPICYARALPPDTLQDALPCVSRYQHPAPRILHRLYIHTPLQDL